MKIADSVTQVLDGALPEVDDLTEILCSLVRESRWLRAFLRGEPRDSQRIYVIRFSSLQLLLGETLRADRVNEGDGEAFGSKSREQILPMVARGLHRDEAIAGLAQ